jgi:hypothetical protein
MRLASCILAISAGFWGHEAAAGSLSEAPPTGAWHDAEDIVETACEIDIQLHGTVAEVQQTEHFANGGAKRLAAAVDLALPDGARIISASQRREAGPALPALPVPATAETKPVEDAGVLGADPVSVTQAGASYQIVVQPIDPGRQVAVSVRWTAIAEVRSGAIRLVLPGRADPKLAPCHGNVRAAAGPGARVTRVHAPDKDQVRIADADVTVSADLAFAGKQPVLWRQAEDLGDGWTAQALTVIAPPAKATATLPRRVLLVIDTSRSMQLVGSHVIKKLLAALETALPAGTELEAIAYDRTAARLLGAWQPAEAKAFATIAKALDHRTPVNGSDAQAALALAHTTLDDGARGQAMVIAITDGVFGTIDEDALSRPLGGRSGELDLHAIVVDPTPMRTPGEAPLRAAIHAYGGTFIEVGTDGIDQALENVDAWLRPSWLEMKLTGADDMPSFLRAGTGVTFVSVVRPGRKIMLTGEGDAQFATEAVAGPAAPLAGLALARTTDANLLEADDLDTAAAARKLDKLIARHPEGDMARAFVVLANTGSVAKSRRAMVAGGGPYTRIVEVDDPGLSPEGPAQAPPQRYTQVDRITLERLFRDQLRPRAYACYERALGKHAGLAGKVTFSLDIGRGEITRASVTGLGDTAFDACLLDVAYSLELPLPDPAAALDDLTIAHYPLEFRMHEDKPFVIAGDADSSSPLDIGKIEPMQARARGPVTVETSTPLGQLRPTP